MVDIFKDTIPAIRWMWCVINNLEKFNNKPELILRLIKEYRKIEDHTVLSTFENIIDAIEHCYTQTGVFPGLEKLKTDFRDVRAIYYTADPFSMQIYNDLLRYIQQEYIKQQLDLKVVGKEDPNVEDIAKLAKEMENFAKKTKKILLPSKEEILNSYQKAVGGTISSGIAALDNIITAFDSRALNVIACPSGHGKTVLALNVAYNNLIQGKNVLYLSFELSYDKIYNCFACLKAYDNDEKVPISNFNKGTLTEEQENIRLKYLEEITKQNITVLDTTALNNISSFEELLDALEFLGNENKADLIVVDNVDGLGRYAKSSGSMMTEVNNMISQLEHFAQSYCQTGTTILLLAQTNREGIKMLKKGNADYTCISTYSDVYQKARTVIVGYANEENKKQGIMQLYLVKSTFTAPTQTNLKIGVNYDYIKTINNAVFSYTPEAPQHTAAEEAEIDNVLCLDDDWE